MKIYYLIKNQIKFNLKTKNIVPIVLGGVNDISSQVLPKNEPTQWGLINAFGQNCSPLYEHDSNKGQRQTDRDLDMIMVRWRGNSV